MNTWRIRFYSMLHHLKHNEVTGHEICEGGLSSRRHLGHRGADTALLPDRPHGTAVCGADGSPAVLLWLPVGGDGVADCVSHDRVEPGALPAADDPGHCREVRSRRRGGR